MTSMSVRSKRSYEANFVLRSASIFFQLMAAVSACIVRDASPFFGDRGSVIPSISLPLLSGGCSCADKECIFSFTQMPLQGAFYEMSILADGNQVILNRTSPKLRIGDQLRSTERTNFGTFLFVPSFKFYGAAFVNFNFSYNGLVFEKNFTLIVNFNNSVPYSGEGGHMLSFDGYDDFVRATVPLNTKLYGSFPAFSLSFWVKNTKRRSGQVLISAWAGLHNGSATWTGGRQWALFDTGNLNFQVHGKTLSEGTGFDIRDSKWHFVCLSWKIKSGLVDIFVDGVKATIPVPEWELPDAVILMLGNMQLVTDIIPSQKAENDVLYSRSLETVDANSADSLLSPSYAEKWYAAQTKASSLLSNLNGGMGSPKNAGTIAGIPSSYTHIYRGVQDAYRYAMFGIAECTCSGYGAATKFAFGGHIDEFRMFNEAKDTIDFLFSMNHMYSPTMFERYQTADSAVATNSFASGQQIKVLEKLWIYWNFDYIYEFLVDNALPILENIRAGLLLQEARGSSNLFDSRMRSVLDNTPQAMGVVGILGDEYFSFRMPVRALSDAPLVGSVAQFLSVYPDGNISILNLAVEDFENRTNILVRIENMPIVGSLFQVKQDDSIGDQILSRGTIITNSDFKIAYSGDKGLCKSGIKVFNVDGELVDKDTAADSFDIFITDVKIIPPILNPDTPPALRFSKIVLMCALYRVPVAMPNFIIQTLQNSSIMFELQAVSLEKPTSTSLVITKLPSRGSLWTTRWIHVDCNDTSVSCICGDDPLECDVSWNPRKECKNQTMDGSKKYACLVTNAAVNTGVRYENPLSVIYTPTEFFSGNDSVSYNVVIKNNDGRFSEGFNEESATIVVIPKLLSQTASLFLSAIPNTTAGDCVNISFGVNSDNVAIDSLLVRVTAFPMHGTMLLPSRPNYGQSDSQGVPHRQLSKTFDITFDGFTKSNAITRKFRTQSSTVKKNLSYRNYMMSGDTTSAGSSFFKQGMHNFRNSDESKASMNLSQTFESVCGDLGVVQSYVEFSGFFTIERVRFMSSLPLDTFIRFVAPQSILQGNSSTIKRRTEHVHGAAQFKNCPEFNCTYPWAYNVRKSLTEYPNIIKTESSFNNVQSDELYEYWRGFAGQGQHSTSQNAIRDYFFSSSLPTKFLIIEMCGTRQSWPGSIDGGNPIDEVQGLIVRVTKGGNRGTIPVGTSTLMYRSSPLFIGQDRFKLSLESTDGRVFDDVEVVVNVGKSRVLASKFASNIQQEVGTFSSHTLMTMANVVRYELMSKSPDNLELFRLDSTLISSVSPNLHPDASQTISLKLGSASLCGENSAFASFRVVRIGDNVMDNGHNISISLVCPPGLLCIPSIKQCRPCESGTYYNDPPTTYNPILALSTPSGYCIPCEPGTYTDSPGQTLCKKCDAGFSSAPRSTSCKPCDMGYFNPKPGGVCNPCPQGEFQSQPAQSFCYACGLLGFSAGNTSVQCADCPTNMHAEYEKTFNVAHCTCNSGYYRLSRSNDLKLMADQACLPCPTGAFCAGMDLLPVPKNGFWTDTSLWSNGRSFFLQCYHRGVSNQCQGHPTIDYQFNQEICKFRDTKICFQDEYDGDTFLSYTKNLACSSEYSGVLCFECSEGDKLSTRNFLGACITCPSNVLGYIGIFVQSILTIAAWMLILIFLVCQVHCVSLLLVHFQLLAVLSDAAVQNSVVVDSYLKGFHLFMFDLNFIPWSCIFRTGFSLFFKHIAQVVVFVGFLAAIDFRGKKMVRDATLFRVHYNAQKSKISTDGINQVNRRSLRSRNTYGDNSSMGDASSVGSANSKGEARSWKNLFQSSQSEKSETPVVDLMRPNTAGSSKSHNSWFSKVSAWRKQHVKAEDVRLESRKLMTTEEIDEMRYEQFRVLLAASQALAIPILYNILVMIPCLEYSDEVSRIMWVPTYLCASLSHTVVSIIGVMTAFLFTAWIPGQFIYKCVSLWLQDDWDHPQFLKQYCRFFTLSERKHRWFFSVLTLHGPVLTLSIIMSQLQPATGITAALVWIGIKTVLTAYMRPYIKTNHNIFSLILNLHLSVAYGCALQRTNIFSASYLTFTLDRFEVSTDALDGLIHIIAFIALLFAATFAILLDCIHCKVQIPPSVAIVFNVMTGKPHAVFRKFLTDAWNFWQKLNRKYAKWVRPRTSLVQFGKDVQRTESRERVDVVKDSIIALKAAYPTESPFIFDTNESDLGEWAAHPRKTYHFINACMIRIQELETNNSKSDKILALQSKVNCALRCLINFNRLDYEDAFQRQYQLQGYAETLVWDIDVMNRHLQKLGIGIEGREAVGESTQQWMDHMERRIPDAMNWRKRYEHERDRRLLIQKKIDELNMFMKQYMDSSDDEAEDKKQAIPPVKEQAGEPPPPLGPRYRPAESLPAFLRD